VRVFLLLAALWGSVELVPPAAGHRTVSASLALGEANIAPAAFVEALLDCRAYPMSASYLGVRALEACQNLGRDGRYTLMYQRTGGNALIRSRHYVIAMEVVRLTEQRATVQWHLVRHDRAGDQWTGPYAALLTSHPDATWTPYNEGTWDLDLSARALRYQAALDPGGAVPAWLVSEAAVLAFPRALLASRFGVAL
jgi:hypothetical protein